MKKTLAILLALVMLFAVNCTAFASTGALGISSLTINGNAATETVTTVGGVSRYTFNVVLSSGTQLSTLAPATIAVTCADSSATVAINGTSATLSGGVYTGTATLSNTYATVTVTNGANSRDYVVTAAIDGTTISVTITVDASNAYNWANGTYNNNHPAYDAGSPSGAAEAARIRSTASYLEARCTTLQLVIADGSTVMDALSAASARAGNTFYVDGLASGYVSGMGKSASNLISAFTCGSYSGWMYKVDGVIPNYGASQYCLDAGDNIVWAYTCNYGWDIGGGF